MKVVPGTKCFQNFFQNFLGPKKRNLDPYKNRKKLLLNFFLIFGLCTVTKCEKVVLFGFSTGIKGEFRIFMHKN